MTNFLWVLVLFFLLYFLPGFSFSRFFEGRLKNSPFLILFLSFLVLPVFYTFLIVVNQLNLTLFILLNLAFLALALGLPRRLNNFWKVDLDSLVGCDRVSFFLVLAAAVYFFLVMSPRLGLWQGLFPIGDDQHQIRKIVSVAESPAAPLFYHFPTTKLTIYYFNNVAPGLWVKFSQNVLKANQAWFIHVGLQTILLLWLIIRLGSHLFSKPISRYVFFFCLTFFSGMEFFIYLWRRPIYLDQLEWWSDWFLPQSRLHMQISNPFTLFFWVPQHLMAALFVLMIFLIRRSNQRSRLLTQIFLALLWANILGNSAFVFLSAVLVYLIFEAVEFYRHRDWKTLCHSNWLAVALAIVFSANNLVLFSTAEKGSYVVAMANVFWFVSNTTTVGKLTNLFLTVPIYLAVEFGVLFLVYVYAGVQFFCRPAFRQQYLFFYFFLFLLPIIFFVKALDDNNISMRAFIPAQIALAIFAAEAVSQLRMKPALFLLLIFLMLLSLPTGLFDFWQRFKEQFHPQNDVDYSFYRLLDAKLPLNSIVFAPFSKVDQLTAVGHRFSFKNPSLFSATDREHTARSQVEKYGGLNFAEAKAVRAVLAENPNLAQNFRLYSLVNLGGFGLRSEKIELGSTTLESLYLLSR